MASDFESLETRIIHAGEPDPFAGAVVLPIFQSSTYLTFKADSYHDQGYIRLNNTPNHEALHAKIASLEGTEDALVAGSGMAAISTALLTVLKSGDHFLAINCLYGGTHALVTKDLPDFGIESTFFDAGRPETWEGLLRKNTRAIYVESLTNPLLQVPDLPAVIEFAQKHDLVTLIDSTFTSPVNFRPAELGFDLVLHSATKYYNGHDDIVAGVVAGKKALVERVKHRLNHLGGTLDPHACFLLHRGMKTMAVRVRAQNESSLTVAKGLEAHPKVTRVHHPGLESHPQHARARELFSGTGGMLSFELEGGVAAADKMLSRVRIPYVAPSLGGVESLITRPALTAHKSLTPEERKAFGIAEGLIRLSVGLEHPDEILADLVRAIEG
jgi:cystathionine beta-lyase/cystathionine gamma-synthase